jgi:putative membrane protein
MSDANSSNPVKPPASSSLPVLSIPEIVARGALGGTLMGLANLVPGISGGTMLVVAGIFTVFIAAIADVTTLRLTRRAIITLASVVIPAGLAILLLAGVVRNLVVDHRWLMYSLFIGWTLGGVPTVWAMATAGGGSRSRSQMSKVWIGATIGISIMIAMVLVQAGARAAGDAAGPGTLLLFAGGVVASAAMVLPGLSGGYLLLLLGLYVPILDAIDSVKNALQARDAAAMIGVLGLVIPLGAGIVVGIVGVSHLVRFLLRRFEKITMGVLLGLLVGAFLGLFPFQRPVEPEPGTIIKGQVVTRKALDAGEIKPKDWPVEYFAPGVMQVGVSLLLIAAAASSTLMIARTGRRSPATEVQSA